MLYAETGRYPLYVAINYQIIKYWLKILNCPNTSYVKIVYVELMKAREKKVKHLLCSCEFGSIWYNQKVSSNERTSIKSFERRNKDMYGQLCLSEINSCTRCRFYKEVKQVFTSEPYLADRMDKHLRTSYTKFRQSSHKLLVESGRWLKPKLQYEMRR